MITWDFMCRQNIQSKLLSRACVSLLINYIHAKVQPLINSLMLMSLLIIGVASGFLRLEEVGAWDRESDKNDGIRIGIGFSK